MSTAQDFSAMERFAVRAASAIEVVKSVERGERAMRAMWVKGEEGLEAKSWAVARAMRGPVPTMRRVDGVVIFWVFEEFDGRMS